MECTHTCIQSKMQHTTRCICLCHVVVNMLKKWFALLNVWFYYVPFLLIYQSFHPVLRNRLFPISFLQTTLTFFCIFGLIPGNNFPYFYIFIDHLKNKRKSFLSNSKYPFCQVSTALMLYSGLKLF